MTFDISDAQLLQLIGLREAELFVLRQRVAVLEQQLKMIAELNGQEAPAAPIAEGSNGAVHE